jgi:hypothetical protein
MGKQVRQIEEPERETSMRWCHAVIELSWVGHITWESFGSRQVEEL